MKKNGSIILAILFSLTAVLFFAPMLQQNLEFFSFKKLSGYKKPAPKPELTYKTYTTGTFQKQEEQYLKEHFGFREPLIRMYNQWTYDWFKTTSNREISIGKDGWLYHTESALHYYGNMESWFGLSNSQVRDHLIKQARSLSKVNVILKEYDVHLLTFTLPTKSFIYPEHLRRQPVGDTTFNAVPFLERQLDSLGVPHINMIPWFQQLQDTTPFDLFYSKGSHWAAGAPLAVDTILRAMEHIDGRSLAHVQVGFPYSLEEIPYNDNDLEYLLNLARPLKREPIHEYPVSLWADDSTAFPTVWFVGTSFYWYLTRRVNFDALFRFRDLLFYDALFYTNSEKESLDANNLDYLHELLLHDYVVFFRDGPQLYTSSLVFPGKSLITLCISPERMKEKTEAIADSLAKVWHDSHPEKKKENYLFTARLKLYQNPELFEELRGDSIPAYRNPKIAQVLAERAIRADRTWSFLIETKAKNDSLDTRSLYWIEANNMMNNKYLNRNKAYFTTYDYFDYLIEETMLDLWRRGHNTLSDDNLFDLAKSNIEMRIQQHAFDDDTLMMMACAMEAFAKQLGKEEILPKLRSKAEEKQISIDKAFRDDVTWCFRNGKDNWRYLTQEAIVKGFDAYLIERKMRNNEETMANLMQKHHDLNLPFRLVVNRDIEWVRKRSVKQ
jgi:hypothetical protein